MDIKKMIKPVPDELGKFKKRLMYTSLRKDIKKELAAVHISAKELSKDLRYIMTADEFKEHTTDNICYQYDIPIKGVTKLKEYLLTSYYYANMENIMFMKDMYELDPTLFSNEKKKEYLSIMCSSASIEKLLLNVAQTKHIDSLLDKYDKIKNNLSDLHTYYKKLAE